MNPKFLRFPDGNYLEGNRTCKRFPWQKTLGPIEDRPASPLMIQPINALELTMPHRELAESGARWSGSIK